MRKTVKLTAKTAKALVKKVLGISGKELEKDKTAPGVDIYRMRTDVLEVVVSNDWYNENGRYKVVISSCGADGDIWLYFWPETLEEDWETETQQLEKIKQEEYENHCQK